jgi:hypothetical protein
MEVVAVVLYILFDINLVEDTEERETEAAPRAP